MKKKSLFDIAMEKKDNNLINDDKVIIIKKRSVISTLFDICGKLLKFILYIAVFVLLTIGATVLINGQTREMIVEILKQTI